MKRYNNLFGFDGGPGNSFTSPNEAFMPEPYDFQGGDFPPSSASSSESVEQAVGTNKSILGTALSVGVPALVNLFMNYQNNRANDRRQQEAYEQNLRMWHMQNEYNSPASQIARLRAAGLNPNLIYGSPDNTAQAPPSKGVSEGHAGQVDPMVAMNALNILKQMELVDADIALKESQARNFDSDTERQNLENDVFPQKFSASMQEVFSRINVNNAEADKLFNESKVAYENYIAKQLENYFNTQTMQDRISLVAKQLDLTDADIKVAKATASKMYAEISYLQKKGELITEQKYTEIARRSLISAQEKTEGFKQANFVADSEYKQTYAVLNRALAGEANVRSGNLMLDRELKELQIGRTKTKYGETDDPVANWINGPLFLTAELLGTIINLNSTTINN